MDRETFKRIPGLQRSYRAVRQAKNTLCHGWAKNLSFHLRGFRCTLGRDDMAARLETLRDTQSGRCFLVATGPSLTLEDVRRLRGETTFGMNALVKWFPQMGFETTYYGIQDLNTYKKLKNEIHSTFSTTIFYSLSGQAKKGDRAEITLGEMERAYEYPLYYGNHLYNATDWNTKFSENPSKMVYDGYTIAYSLLQIAVYLGFTEIYLLGADCNYNQEKKNMVDIGVKNPNAPILGDRMIYAYTVAKEYADSHGIQILNATRGGMLEVFPRVRLEEIL